MWLVVGGQGWWIVCVAFGDWVLNTTSHITSTTLSMNLELFQVVSSGQNCNVSNVLLRILLMGALPIK